MKPGIPWSVKGIDSEAREAAKHAARRSGVTLGEWLNTVIREQAGAVEPQPMRPREFGHDIHSKLDHLSTQLASLSRREQDTTAGRYFERTHPSTQDHTLADIIARLEAGERQTSERLAIFGQRIDTLGDKLAGS